MASGMAALRLRQKMEVLTSTSLRPARLHCQKGRLSERCQQGETYSLECTSRYSSAFQTWTSHEGHSSPESSKKLEQAEPDECSMCHTHRPAPQARQHTCSSLTAEGQHRVQAQKRKIGDDLTAETMKATEEAIADFKRNLEAFALNHREAIRSDPEFRSQFHAMCAHIGVDPLASNKSTVTKYLDFKDWSFASFYFELAVSVVEVCRPL